MAFEVIRDIKISFSDEHNLPPEKGEKYRVSDIF
jgi:hypothetical protein